jgi:hypothetical protein
VLRGAPNAFFTDWSFDPYLNATCYTGRWSSTTCTSVPVSTRRTTAVRFDAALFDNGGALTHRTSPVAAVRALAARLGVEIGEEDAARGQTRPASVPAGLPWAGQAR